MHQLFSRPHLDSDEIIFEGTSEVGDTSDADFSIPAHAGTMRNQTNIHPPLLYQQYMYIQVSICKYLSFPVTKIPLNFLLRYFHCTGFAPIETTVKPHFYALIC